MLSCASLTLLVRKWPDSGTVLNLSLRTKIILNSLQQCKKILECFAMISETISDDFDSIHLSNFYERNSQRYFIDDPRGKKISSSNTKLVFMRI